MIEAGRAYSPLVWWVYRLRSLSQSPSIHPPQHSSSLLHKGSRMRTLLSPLTPLRLAGLRPLSQRLQAQQIRSLRIADAMKTSRRQTTATMLPGLAMSKARWV